MSENLERKTGSTTLNLEQIANTKITSAAGGNWVIFIDPETQTLKGLKRDEDGRIIDRRQFPIFNFSKKRYPSTTS